MMHTITHHSIETKDIRKGEHYSVYHHKLSQANLDSIISNIQVIGLVQGQTAFLVAKEPGAPSKLHYVLQCEAQLENIPDSVRDMYVHVLGDVKQSYLRKIAKTLLVLGTREVRTTNLEKASIYTPLWPLNAQ